MSAEDGFTPSTSSEDVAGGTSARPEQAGQPPVSFAEAVRNLTVSIENQPALIADPKLARLAKTAAEDRNQDPDSLARLLAQGDTWYLADQVPEKQWQILAPVLDQRKKELAESAEPKTDQAQTAQLEERVQQLGGLLEQQAHQLKQQNSDLTATRAENQALAQRLDQQQQDAARQIDAAKAAQQAAETARQQAEARAEARQRALEEAARNAAAKEEQVRREAEEGRVRDKAETDRRIQELRDAQQEQTRQAAEREANLQQQLQENRDAAAKDRQGLERQLADLRQQAQQREQQLQAAIAALRQGGGQAERGGQLTPEQTRGGTRQRFADMMYLNRLWTQIQIGWEPDWYNAMGDQERRVYDVMLQLARAAYWKKTYIISPEKMVENGDLSQLTPEDLRRLYEIPGARHGLEWYVDAIVNGTPFIVEDVDGDDNVVGEREVTFWDCGDEETFELFREAMRTAIRERNPGLTELQLKEADAVAWNLIFVSNLIESCDSRYSVSGRRHDTLQQVSDDLRSTIHMQEKFESKLAHPKILEWGAFGKWGAAQMARIRNETRYSSRAEFVFKPAGNVDWYWRAGRTANRTAKGGNIIEIYVPECYPTTTLVSFWEETKAGPDGKESRLIDYLLRGEEIPWIQMDAPNWGASYLGVKLLKAVKLAEYFKPGVPMDTRKFGYAKEWADLPIDAFARLGLDRKLSSLVRDRKSSQTLFALKRWAVYAAHGGVANPGSKKPKLNLGIVDAITLSSALRDKNVRYLGRGEEL